MRSAALGTALLGTICCLALAKPSGTEKPSEPNPRPVVVEALGFAAVDEAGMTMAQAHREALLDAQRNAMMQAHVFLRTETVVKNMRVQETRLYSCARGYIEKIHVWEAGIMPDTNPPVYRVRIRAVIGIRDQAEAEEPLYVAQDNQWQPLLELRVSSNLPRERQESIRFTLAQAMRNCGIRIAQAHSKRPRLVAEVTVSGGLASQDKPFKVKWQMGFGEAALAANSEADNPAKGQWLVVAPGFPTARGWEKLGITLAQEAIRLWAKPRPTLVTFQAAEQEQAQTLVEAFGKSAEVQADKGQTSSTVLVHLMAAGDPLHFIQPALEDAGLADEVELVQCSLTRLTFRFSPADEKGPKPGPRASHKGEKGA